MPTILIEAVLLMLYLGNYFSACTNTIASETEIFQGMFDTINFMFIN